MIESTNILKLGLRSAMVLVLRIFAISSEIRAV